MPVAAVDVFNAAAEAYMGKLNTDKLLEAIQNKTTLTDDEQAIKDGYLPVSGKVTVKANADSAKVQYNHLVTADAASAGGKTMVIGDTTFNAENWEETVDPHRTYNGWACIRYGIG